MSMRKLMVAGLIAASACVLRAGEDSDMFVRAAAAAADRAKAAVEMALMAMDNAMAALDDAQATVLVAMKSEDRQAMAVAEKKWKAATDAAEEARNLVKIVLEASAECRAAAGSVAAAAAQLSSAHVTDKEKRSILRRMAEKVEIARKALRKAEDALAILKKKWLDPDFSVLIKTTTTTTTTTTTIPPSPTPVGKR